MSAQLKTALTLAERGWHLLPCLPRSKAPALPNGIDGATDNFDVIRQWWKQQPDCNVAVRTGRGSGVWILDIDGAGAERELTKLEAENGQLPATVETITPRPGRHLFFKWPADKPIGNTVGRLAPGIDSRGERGYALLPPSITYGSYHWSVDAADRIADAPAWLLEKISAPRSRAPKPPAYWRELVAAGIDEGGRDVTCTRLAGYLLHAGLDPLVVLELLQSFNTTKCRPPLERADIHRIVNSICGKELRRRGHA